MFKRFVSGITALLLMITFIPLNVAAETTAATTTQSSSTTQTTTTTNTVQKTSNGYVVGDDHGCYTFNGWHTVNKSYLLDESQYNVSSYYRIPDKYVSKYAKYTDTWYWKSGDTTVNGNVYLEWNTGKAIIDFITKNSGDSEWGFVVLGGLMTPAIVSKLSKESGTEKDSNLYAAPKGQELELGESIIIQPSRDDKSVKDLFEHYKDDLSNLGFIWRYPDEKQSVTGYRDTALTLRYLGKSHATACKKINDEGQCLEEYLGIKSVTGEKDTFSTETSNAEGTLSGENQANAENSSSAESQEAPKSELDGMAQSQKESYMIIKSKYMTETEVQAMEWNLIISQFAVPYKENLQDVWTHKVWKDIRDKGLVIDDNPYLTSIQNNLRALPFDTVLEAIDLGIDIQNNSDPTIKTRMEDIANCMLEGLEVSYSPLYTEDGNVAYVTDLFTSENNVLTVHDKYAVTGSSTSKTEMWDALTQMQEDYLKQVHTKEDLATAVKSGSNVFDVVVPVWVNTDGVKLYNAIFVANAIRINGYGDFKGMLTSCGNSQLYIDRWGNICAYIRVNNEPHMCIVYPAYANPLFTSTEPPDDSIIGYVYEDFENPDFWTNYGSMYSPSKKNVLKTQEDIKTTYLSQNITELSNNDYLGTKDSLSRNHDYAKRNNGKYFGGTYNREIGTYQQDRDMIPIIELDNTTNMIFNKAILSAYTRDGYSHIMGSNNDTHSTDYYKDNWYSCLNDRNTSYTSFALTDMYNSNQKDALFSNSIVFDKYNVSAMFETSTEVFNSGPHLPEADGNSVGFDPEKTTLRVCGWKYDSSIGGFSLDTNDKYFHTDNTNGLKVIDTTIPEGDVITMYPFMQMHTYRKGLYSNKPSLQPTKTKGWSLNTIFEDRYVAQSWKLENTVACEDPFDSDITYSYNEVYWDAMYSDSDKYKTYVILNYTNKVVPSNSSIYGLGNRMTKDSQGDVYYVAEYLDDILLSSSKKHNTVVGKTYMSIPLMDTTLDTASQWSIWDTNDKTGIVDSVQKGLRDWNVITNDTEGYPIKSVSKQEGGLFFEPIEITSPGQASALRYILNDQRVSDVLENYPKEDVTLLSFVWRNYYIPETPFRTKLNKIIPTETTGGTSTSSTSTTPTETTSTLEVFNNVLSDISNNASITAHAEGRLKGIKIGIDPGHQKVGDMSTDWDKDSSGNYILDDNGKKVARKKAPADLNISESKEDCTFRVKSGCELKDSDGNKLADEYEITMQISNKLKKALESEGATVVMTRTSNEVDLSNYDRAMILNNANVDFSIRIHVDSTDEGSSAKGFTLYIPDADGGAYVRHDKSKACADIMASAYATATGLTSNGVKSNNTYVGSNWSKSPCILFETGFGSNPSDAEFLCSESGQDKVVTGIVNGFADYYKTNGSTSQPTSANDSSNSANQPSVSNTPASAEQQDDGRTFTYTLEDDTDVIPVIDKTSFISKYASLTPYNIISSDGANVNNTIMWTNSCEREQENKLSPGIITVGNGYFTGGGEVTSLTVSNTTIHRVSYNFGELLLSVNKNTEGDNLTRLITGFDSDKEFNTDNILSAIEAFFAHPVISLMTILMGFMQFIHNNVAVGSIGNVFDISWVIDLAKANNVVKMYMIVSASICSIVLILRGLKFMFNKEQKFIDIFKEWSVAVCISTVPIILLNYVGMGLNIMAESMTKDVVGKLAAVEIEKEVTSSEDLNINFEEVYMAYKEQFAAIGDSYESISIKIPKSYNAFTDEMTYETINLKDLYDSVEYSNILAKAKLESTNCEIAATVDAAASGDTSVDTSDPTDSKITKTELDEIIKLYENQNPGVSHLYYSYDTFVPVNYDKYSENIFYYFYDYIKYQYLAYWASQSDSNSNTYSSAAKNFTLPDATKGEKWSSYISRMWDAERYMLLKSYNGMYIMMHDDEYNYNKIYKDDGTPVYKGGYATDMFGLSHLFDMTYAPKESNGYAAIPRDGYFGLKDNRNTHTEPEYNEMMTWARDVKDNFHRNFGTYGTFLNMLWSADKLKIENPFECYPIAYLMDNPTWGIIEKYSKVMIDKDNKNGQTYFENYTFTPDYLWQQLKDDYCYKYGTEGSYINFEEITQANMHNFTRSDALKYENMVGKRIPFRPYASKSALYATTYDGEKYSKTTTAFEEKLMKCNTNIYNKLKDMTEYLQGDIRDSSLIFSAALVATMEFNKTFSTGVFNKNSQLEPQSFTPETMDLDKFMRLTYARSMNDITKNTDVMYMIYEQDGGALTAIIVTFTEICIFVTMITRIGVLLLLLIGCAFVCLSYSFHKFKLKQQMIIGLLMQLLQVFASQFLLILIITQGMSWISSTKTPIARIAVALLSLLVCIAMARWCIYMFTSLVRDFKNFGGAIIQGGIQSLTSRINNAFSEIQNNQQMKNINAMIKNAGYNDAVPEKLVAYSQGETRRARNSKKLENERINARNRANGFNDAVPNQKHYKYEKFDEARVRNSKKAMKHEKPWMSDVELYRELKAHGFENERLRQKAYEEGIKATKDAKFDVDAKTSRKLSSEELQKEMQLHGYNSRRLTERVSREKYVKNNAKGHIKNKK